MIEVKVNMADVFDVIFGAGRSMMLQGIHSYIDVRSICVLVSERMIGIQGFGPFVLS